MTDPQRTGQPNPGADSAKGEPKDQTAASGSPSDPSTNVPNAEESSKLSKEEQMARYEEHLKENDWGHQPC